MNLKIIIGLASFLAIVHSTLSVVSSSESTISLEQQGLLNISYSVANFGFAPFGKTMISTLVQSPGLSLECQTADNNNTQYDQEIQNSFLLIPRGQCPFVTKALHAQQLGAQMAIIMDNETHERGVIMKDNGYGYKVKIPSIFIHHEDGQKLVKLLQNPDSKVLLKIAFPSVKTDKVNVTFYLQAFNRRSYALLKSFQPYFEKIKGKINFKTIHNVFKCGAGKCSASDCYGNGQYCAVHYPHGKSATGKDVLDQQIRQDIIFQTYPTRWWNYMKCIDSQCGTVSEIKDCSKKCEKKYQFNSTLIEQAMKNSFYYDSTNSILKTHAEKIKFSGIDIFPGVTLNNMKMKGSLSGEFIFDDICNTLTNPPKACNQYTRIKIYDERSFEDWFVIISVILLGAALFSLLFCLYRRHMRKRITNEMQGRVDDMVSKYIEFYSQRNNRT